MTSIEKPDVIGATRRAETIRSGMIGYAAALEAIGEAYENRDWVALGHRDWDTYCEREFSEKRLKLTRDQREQAVLAFRGAGMSTRAIASALGVDNKTVRNDLSGAEFSAPEEVRGADGKTYSSTKNPTGGVPVDGTPAVGASPIDGPGTQDTPAGTTPASDALGQTARAGDDQPESDPPADRDLDGTPEPSVVCTPGQPEFDTQTDDELGTCGEAPLKDRQSGLDHWPAAGDAAEALTTLGDETGTGGASPVDPSVPVDGRGQQGTAGVSGPAAPDPDVAGPIGAIRVLAEIYERIDIDVVGPMLTSAEMAEIGDALGRIATVVELLTMWHERTRA